ncbi:MAG: glycosyltransferase family 2 protein [Butyrivibrio sp.]|nr:glycosyltransferase family 2 protein [Butyrivibrio sp.]
MKKISVMIPCYNEEENVVAIGDAVEDIIKKELPEYDYEICYVDNASTDKTRPLIEEICEKNKKRKAIFNVTNFGQFNSPFHGICELDGDCVISVCADFQDPVEMIPVFVHEWEKGHRIVSGVKTSSKENGLIYFLRSMYYKLIKSMSSVHMIEHFTGFGLYDKSFVKLMRELDDPLPFIRGVVAEYGEGFNLKLVEYEQPLRRAGKTHNNFFTLYDAAMLSFTSYTKVGLRLMTMLGFIVGMIDVIVAVVYLVLKLMYWDEFHAGYAPMIIGMFLIGAVQLAFMGFMGEYIMNINTRTIHRPIVVEERRINFEEK